MFLRNLTVTEHPALCLTAVQTYIPHRTLTEAGSLFDAKRFRLSVSVLFQINLAQLRTPRRSLLVSGGGTLET
jgi:hypothetical protein